MNLNSNGFIPYGATRVIARIFDLMEDVDLSVNAYFADYDQFPESIVYLPRMIPTRNSCFALHLFRCCEVRTVDRSANVQITTRW